MLVLHVGAMLDGIEILLEAAIGCCTACSGSAGDSTVDVVSVGLPSGPGMGWFLSEKGRTVYARVGASSFGSLGLSSLSSLLHGVLRVVFRCRCVCALLLFVVVPFVLVVVVLFVDLCRYCWSGRL